MPCGGQGDETMKALGKKPPKPRESETMTWNYVVEKEHYHQALLEAADELEHECQEKCGCYYQKLAKRMKTSAGVK